MGKNNKWKRPRGSRGAPSSCHHPTSLSSDNNSRASCDLGVIMPKTNSKVKAHLILGEIKERLAATGFTHMALAHTIFGRPRPLEDAADKAIDESLLYDENSSSKNAKESSEPDPKKQKVVSLKAQIRVYRRLHAVLESLSDVGAFGTNSQHADLINAYDLVSVSPRNDATFQSACASATNVDIITLDYTAGRGALKLPFRIRSADLKSAAQRNIAFEIPFAPALLNTKQRKALVQTCREFQNASLGVKARLIFSSGERTTLEETDAGAMVLRSPGDLTNLINTVFGFDPKIANESIRTTALEAMSFARRRRFGESFAADVELDDGAKRDDTLRSGKNISLQKSTRTTDDSSLEDNGVSESSPKNENDSNRDILDEEDDGDGFIAM